MLLQLVYYFAVIVCGLKKNMYLCTRKRKVCAGLGYQIVRENANIMAILFLCAIWKARGKRRYRETKLINNTLFN